MRRRQADPAVTLRSHGASGAGGRDGREPVQVALVDARRRAWAPLALRAVAIALALVGLAGIGSVAGRAPALGSALAPGVGSSARLAQLGAIDRVIGFPGAPPPDDERRGAASSDFVAQGGSAGAAAAVDIESPGAGAPCPCPGAAPDAALRVPRGSPSDAPRASSAARARPHAVASEATPSRAASPAAPAITADGRVALNRATVSELMRLPGVGAKRAAAIVEQRQRLGRFREPSELLRIKGIGPRTLERLLPQLVVD